MVSLLLAAALGAAPPEADPVWQCTAAHYRGFVSPSGSRAQWPTVPKLPEHLRDTRHILLSTPGILPGGRAHMMFVDSAARVVYIVQTSGPADTEVVFGPLPPVECPEP